MKVLVTGGAGFIGCHLVDSLLAASLEVAVLDNLSTGSRDNIPRNVPLFNVDIRSGGACRELLHQERPEIVIHLAAQMNVRHSIAHPVADAEVNFLGSLNILEASAGEKVRRVIFASSGGAIYGDQLEYPCRESAPPRPVSPYGIAKLAVEAYGPHFAEVEGMEFTALRLANVYGPRQNPRGEAGIVALFLHKMMEGQAPVILGDGEQTRDFVWIGDVVDAFRLALTGPPGIYNIGTGRETSVNGVLSLLSRMAGFFGKAEFRPAVRGELRRNALSPDLAKKALDWVPSTALEQGLEETVKCVMNPPRSL